ATYLSLEEKNQLPANRFTDKKNFDQWVNADVSERYEPEIFSASTIHRYLPAAEARYQGTLFEYLFSCFVLSLGEGDHVIGIPVSGQLVSRYIRTIGACSCQVALSITIDERTTVQALMKETSIQLSNG